MTKGEYLQTVASYAMTPEQMRNELARLTAKKEMTIEEYVALKVLKAKLTA